jgi:cobalt/nickel transport system permease protein
MSRSDASRLDRHATLSSPIHRLDSRAKVLATLAFVVTVVSFDKYAVVPLLPFALFPMALATAGRVPAGLLVRRMAVATPFVLLVGAFNPFLDRETAFWIGAVSVSHGWLSFASMALRGFLCVASVVVLVATTGVPGIAEAVGGFRVPRPLVTQILLLHRYMFVIAGEAGSMSRARALRAGTDRASLPVAASMLGNLLARSLDRAEGIWHAMQGRGFDGRMPALRPRAWTIFDRAFLFAVATTCLAMRVLPWTHMFRGTVLP